MAESMQQKLSRVRPPRVQITYDVEVGGATQKKELPFVAGVLADLSGSNRPKTALRDRKFVEVDGKNLDQVMRSIAPTFKGSVPGRLRAGQESLPVELSFKTMDDFSPAAISRNVPELARLLHVRSRLNDLLSKLEGNDALDDALVGLVQNREELKQLQSGAPAATEEANG